MNDEYTQDFDPEEQEIDQVCFQTEHPALNKSFLTKNKVFKEKTSNNIVVFFSKFNGLIDRIYSNFLRNAAETLILKEILYSVYEKLFFNQTKFVMLRGNNDFFMNPLNKSLLNDVFENHQKRNVEFSGESHETTIKLFLRFLLSDPSNEIYLLRMKEFYILLKESQKAFKKNKSLDNERINDSALKKYRKLLKKKEGKKDEEILKEIIGFYEGKTNETDKKDLKIKENDLLFNRKVNIEEKRMRTFKEIFLHYIKENSENQKKRESMNIGAFLAFLRDFKITNEFMSKPVFFNIKIFLKRSAY